MTRAYPSLPEAAMVTVWRVDQREYALASTTLGTGPREAASPMPFSMPIIPGHPRKLLGPSRASTSVQRAAARVDGLDSGSSSDPECGPIFAPFFPPGKSAQNPLKRFPSNFMRKRCETRILDMRATMRKWNVNDLLRTRCCTLSCRVSSLTPPGANDSGTVTK